MLMVHKWTQIMSYNWCSKARCHLPTDGTQMDLNSEPQLVLQSKTPLTTWWTQTTSYSLSSKARHYSHADDIQMDPNSEPQLVLQSKTPLTSWWHTNGPKEWTTACSPKQDTTHILMTHKWTQTVSHCLCSKARHHLLSDGTHIDPNCEPQLVLQRWTLLTCWWHTYACLWANNTIYKCSHTTWLSCRNYWFIMWMNPFLEAYGSAYTLTYQSVKLYP